MSNAPNKAESGHNSDDDCVNIEEYSSVEHCRVKVSFCERFAKEKNSEFLNNLFANKNKTNGGPIESLEYRQDEKCAIITYKRKSTAHRILTRPDVEYEGFKFTITEAEKQSKSDYISSKTKVQSAGVMLSYSSVSKSTSVYQPSRK